MTISKHIDAAFQDLVWAKDFLRLGENHVFILLPTSKSPTF